MGVVEAIAIIIFVLVVLVLLYYIITANSNVLDSVKNYVPTSMDISNQGSAYNEDSGENVSMGDKIKGTFNDYTSFTTDAFSKKLNAFLDEKSEELIEDWSLVTKNDLESLEEKWNNTSQSIDDLEKRFEDYKKNTSEDIKDLDERLKALEEV